jgi:very-short-patch-repair endonuclease
MMKQPKQPDWQITRTMRARARSLRRDSTDAERIIWNELRAHRLRSAGFRRQKPIGPYVADFVCQAAKLIVELDGGQHFETEQQKRDARRDAFLAGKGYRVLRFNNYDVMTNRAGILETIAAAIDGSPSPTLPRKREREQARGRGRVAR